MDSPPTTFHAIAPQFVVRDVEKTSLYYRDILGFEVTDKFLEPPVHIIVTKGGAQVFLAQAVEEMGVSNRALKPEGIDAYIRVQGLEALADAYKDRGVKILEGPVKRAYQVRELVVEDLNGFVLVFGEDAG